MSAITKSLLAKTGEALSVEYLQRLGLILLTHNYYSAFGEIDIVLQDKAEIVFVEVKTRSKHIIASAENSITVSKRKKLTKTAQVFINTHPEYSGFSFRFDVVLVFYYHNDETYKLIHNKNAFEPVYETEGTD